MGGPRKRPIWRKIAAKSARGTATSASWVTPEQAVAEAIARVKQLLSE
jgi:hypothetical protein